MSTPYKDQIAYPIAKSAKHAVQVLKSHKVKAAIVVNNHYKLITNEMRPQETDVISQWWASTEQPKKDFISPGEITYVADSVSLERLKQQGQQPELLDLASVEAELKAAGLQVSPEVLGDLHQKMLNAISDFSDIVQEYMNIEDDDFVMRAWQIFAPKGALGRTPVLHSDHSVLTAMWYPYANCSAAQVYTGNVPEDVWRALQPSQKGKTRGKASKKDLHNAMVLKKFTKNASPNDFMTLPDSALIVAKNLKNTGDLPPYRDLSDKKVRQSICLHKSADVSTMGQAGLILIPQITCNKVKL
jgi:hypothetical protein